MNEQDIFAEVRTFIEERNLSRALIALEGYVASRRHRENADRLYAVRSDFQMMADYWKRGYKDPQQQALYNSLLTRLYDVMVREQQNAAVSASPYLSSVMIHLHLLGRDWTPDALRREMETFVSEQAMLELEPPHTRQKKQRDLYRRHRTAMDDFFDYLWTSGPWNDGLGRAMEDILLSPTIDGNDQRFIISGMTLALLNHFDRIKLRTLLHVYLRATDEYVCQYALVGWALGIDAPLMMAFCPQETAEVEKALEDDGVCQELEELQKQLVFCTTAARDSHTMQHEIMPGLLNNGPLRVTRNGIEEVEEDPMDDILNPGEQERKLEQMEESFRKMQEMQKQGSDVYFGGFSHMKRFPFFNKISNWLVPFYIEHPDVVDVAEKCASNAFLKNIMEGEGFCDSDKYSFLLAFNTVVDQLPENIRKMMEKGHVLAEYMTASANATPLHIRRTYLQSLYRFYMIFPYRQFFRSPFDKHGYNFFASGLFRSTHLEQHFDDVAAFFLKHKCTDDALQLLNNYGPYRRDFRFYMMAGYLQSSGIRQLDDESLTAVVCYEKAVQLQPDSERALAGYAKALFNAGRTTEAADNYERLTLMNPDKRNYALGHATCLTELERYEEALKILYRLNYERPDDKAVNRVLAWTLTCAEKYEQAEKMYAPLLTGDCDSADLLNYGYCLWLGGHVDDATDCFHRFMKETETGIDFILESEQELLRKRGITETEQQLMRFLLA